MWYTVRFPKNNSFNTEFIILIAQLLSNGPYKGPSDGGWKPGARLEAERAYQVRPEAEEIRPKAEREDCLPKEQNNFIGKIPIISFSIIN